MKTIKFVNKHSCDKNGFSADFTLVEFIRKNRKYYQEVEDYDWVEVADRSKGLESILHRLREQKTVSLVKQLGTGHFFLDAGCGTGLILRHLPIGSVGLDINPRNINKAKRHAPKANLVEGDIVKMPFSDRYFSCVICTEVLEHLVKPEPALAEIKRVLKPKGRLIGSVPATNPLWRLRFLSSTHPGEPYHMIYRKKWLKSLFNDSWKIISLKRACLGMNFFFVVEKNG